MIMPLWDIFEALSTGEIQRGTRTRVLDDSPFLFYSGLMVKVAYASLLAYFGIFGVIKKSKGSDENT